MILSFQRQIEQLAEFIVKLLLNVSFILLKIKMDLIIKHKFLNNCYIFYGLLNQSQIVQFVNIIYLRNS